MDLAKRRGAKHMQKKQYDTITKPSCTQRECKERQCSHCLQYRSTHYKLQQPNNMMRLQSGRGLQPPMPKPDVEMNFEPTPGHFHQLRVKEL
ncbi:hypothetical protein RRG08_018461 [Elysia crispata]|uniref:Uncharacterized protein n=1 Tax=Elysia crispata TaxID=231223 RepID=A0AAE1D4A0_9GAST|nr:hypothetical protein RRG08_018461 [Elysia crispata]